MKLWLKLVLYGVGLFTVLTLASVYLSLAHEARLVRMSHPAPAPDPEPEASEPAPAVPVKAYVVRYEVIYPDPPRDGRWTFWIFLLDKDGNRRKALYDRPVPSYGDAGFKPWTYTFIGRPGQVCGIGASDNDNPHGQRLIVRIYVDGALVAQKIGPEPVAYVKLQ